jgi:hypothetical protein
VLFVIPTRPDVAPARGAGAGGCQEQETALGGVAGFGWKAGAKVSGGKAAARCLERTLRRGGIGWEGLESFRMTLRPFTIMHQWKSSRFSVAPANFLAELNQIQGA